MSSLLLQFVLKLAQVSHTVRQVSNTFLSSQKNIQRCCCSPSRVRNLQTC